MLGKNNLIIIIILGLVLRILLAFIPGFKTDIDDWAFWANRLTEVNFSNFYSDSVFSDYTPGYLYVLYILGWINKFFTLDTPAFYFILKIPAILAEVGIGFLVYKILKKRLSEKLSIFGASLILFNPALIFNSSIWGQVDSIPTFFMLIALDRLINKDIKLATFIYSLSLIIKPQSIAILPVFILFFIKEKNRLRLIFNFLIILLATVFFLSYPFFPNHTLINLTNLIIKSGNLYPYTSLGAFNFWGIIGFWIPDKTTFSTFSYQEYAITAFIINWMILGYLFLRKKLSIYSLSALATLSFFFLLTRMHERYLYSALPLLIISSLISKSRLLIILSCIMGLLHFINLYFVYIYYDHFSFHLDVSLYNQTLYDLLSNHIKELLFISTTCFIFIYVNLIKQEYVKKIK